MTRVAAVVIIWILVLAPVPAFADAAGPTSYRSEVLDVQPAGAADVEIVGGDAFVRLVAAPGRDIVVAGYEGEPYLRFTPDGTVLRNRRSPATYLNDDRYGQVQIPDIADPARPPDWETVATGGTWSWHDHRTHWMARTVPSIVAESGRDATIDVFTWEVPLVVDGQAGQVRGVLRWVPPVAPYPWIALAVGVAAIAATLHRRRAAVVMAASVVAATVAAGAYLIQPPDARAVGLELIAPLVAVAISAYATVRSRRGNGGWADGYVAIAAAVLVIWAVWSRSVFHMPVLPNLWPAPLVRGGAAVAGGAAAGVMATWARRDRDHPT